MVDTKKIPSAQWKDTNNDDGPANSQHICTIIGLKQLVPCEDTKTKTDLCVSRFEKRGHFGPDLNFEILKCSETIGNQLSFTACFMYIAAWIHFFCTFI